MIVPPFPKSYHHLFRPSITFTTEILWCSVCHLPEVVHSNYPLDTHYFRSFDSGVDFADQTFTCKVVLGSSAHFIPTTYVIDDYNG